MCTEVEIQLDVMVIGSDDARMVEKDVLFYFLDRPVQVVRKFRAQRMTLSMRPEKPMRLTAGVTTSRGEILHFLQSHTEWIRKNIEKIKVIESRYQRPQLKDGSLFPYLGELKSFLFAQSRKLRPWFAIEDGFLLCYLPAGRSLQDFSEEELIRALQSFYKWNGVAYLQERIPAWIGRTGFEPEKVKFNRATTRWGSCNSKKQINLNWKLICHAPHLVDYVIVHELCHLLHMNHSEQFWNLVETFMPEYRIYEKVLDEQTYLSSFLNV